MKAKKIKKPKIAKWGKNEKELNNEQEVFCECYVNGGRELMGNGVQSYIEAYQPDTTDKNWYKTACARASQLLSNIKLIKRINELIKEWGLNDQHVDKQLSFLISQYADNTNKLWAIKEYNRLKARVIEKGNEINLNVDLSGKNPK